MEIILPLLLNKSIVFSNDKAMYNPQMLSELLQKYNIDCAMFTPSKLKGYMSDRNFIKSFSNLQCVMLGGESLSERLYKLIRGKSNVAIFNAYGPTETTCGALITNIIDNDITIGKPIANTQIYITDKYLKLVPIGVTGELCIAGDGVGAGYLNRPELTAEKFIDNIFGKGKLYRTGDLAYWRDDGNIVYVGRNDFQVKIRGLRIELGEIENAIKGFVLTSCEWGI